MTRNILSFLGATVVTAIAMSATPAEAFTYRSHSATGCMSVEETPSPHSLTSTGQYSNYGAIVNSDTYQENIVLCPIVSDSNISAVASTASLTIDGYSNSFDGECGNYDGTGGLPALYACDGYGVGGGECNLYTSMTNMGQSYGANYSIAWNHPWTGLGAEYYDSFYLQITLGCAGSGGNSAVWDYVLYN